MIHFQVTTHKKEEGKGVYTVKKYSFPDSKHMGEFLKKNYPEVIGYMEHKNWELTPGGAFGLKKEGKHYAYFVWTT